MVGGRCLDTNTSDQNIKKVTEELSKHQNINIFSSDVGLDASPSAIVFNPQTAELKHAVPGKIESNTYERIARLSFSKPNLNFGFDYSKDKNEIATISFTEYQKKQLQSKQIIINSIKQSESWKANTEQYPIIKTFEKIEKIEDIFDDNSQTKIENKGYNQKKFDTLKQKVTEKLINENDADIEQKVQSIIGSAFKEKKSFRNVVLSKIGFKKHVSINLDIESLKTNISNNSVGQSNNMQHSSSKTAIKTNQRQ